MEKIVTSRIDVYTKHDENTEAKMDRKKDTECEASNWSDDSEERVIFHINLIGSWMSQLGRLGWVESKKEKEKEEYGIKKHWNKEVRLSSRYGTLGYLHWKEPWVWFLFHGTK